MKRAKHTPGVSTKYKFRKPELLLHPNIPKPLHGVNPRSIKGQVWWDKVRQKAYAKNNYCCWACGIHKSKAKYHNWLEAHENYDINIETGKIKLIELVALCHSCHNSIHDGRLEMLLDKGEISTEKYLDIIVRKDKILKHFGLERDTSTPKKVAKWSEWHLELEGKNYYSPYANIVEWYEHYNPTSK